MPDLPVSLEDRAASGPSRRAGSRRRPPPPKRRRSRRRLLLAVLLTVGVPLLVWAALLAVSAASVNREAGQARAELDKVRAALAAGDVTSARQAQDAAAGHIDAATSRADGWPVSVLRRVPVVSVVATDLDHLLVAGRQVVNSSGELVTGYAGVTGEDGAPALLSDGKVDLARLPDLRQHVEAAAAALTVAEQELRLVQGGVPGLGRIAAQRDSTLREVVPARRGLSHAGVVLGRLPAALGAKQPQRYLLSISNESELRASGGAPLSVAMLTFDRGRISVSRTLQAEDLPQRLTWRGDPGSPFNDPDGTRTDRFANASFHPDFRTAASDLMGAAEAAGFPRLSGVLAVDVRAIAEVLRVSGPLESPAYGEVTADNVGQTLLIDAYGKFAKNQDVRQGLNGELRDALLNRLLTGQAAVPVLRALAGSAPGRHVQLFTTDTTLENELADVHSAGVVRGGAPDLVGVFSQNGNGSKVDVFQRRTIRVDARVASDGSATVTQTVQIVNDVPVGRVAVKAKSGYLTGWSRNAYFVYLAKSATAPELSSSAPGFSVVPFDGKTWVDDGHGQRLGRVVGELAPGARGELTLSYSLPAGTFGKTGDVRYSVRALTQPLWQPATLEVTVTGPGASGKRSVLLDRDRVVRVPRQAG